VEEEKKWDKKPTCKLKKKQCGGREKMRWEEKSQTLREKRTKETREGEMKELFKNPDGCLWLLIPQVFIMRVFSSQEVIIIIIIIKHK
jgi:hypothetical protein